MSLIKKSDVENHRSAKRRSLYTFGLHRTASGPGNTLPGTNVGDIGIKSSHPISRETKANAHVAGSVGVPVNARTSGSGPW